MTFKQHSLTLHFGEADEECWEILKELSHDRQESVIKEALRLYLGVQLESLRPNTTQLELEHELNDEINHELNPVQHQGYDHEHDQSYSQLPSPWSENESTSVNENQTEQIETPSDWQLDSLFVSSEHKKEITDPLKHLFQIIGEEDDEEVIDFLSTSAKTDSTVPWEGGSPEGNDYCEIEAGTAESLTGEVMSHTGTIPISLESQREENLVRSSGLSFILQQVIGKEEDEEVLEFFENSRKEEPEF